VAERRTQAERRTESRQRLIEAAIRLLAVRGYARTSLVEIGKEAGLSRGLVSHHFGSKEACMKAVVDHIREVSRWRTTSLTTPGSKVDHILDSYFRGVARRDAGALAMYVVLVEGLTATPGLGPAIAETNLATRDFIAEQIAAELDPPAVDGANDPEIQSIAVMVAGLLRGVSLQWLADPDGVDLDAAVEMAKRMVRTTMDSLRVSA
jgi:AcrR family transcriptional regulator